MNKPVTVNKAGLEPCPFCGASARYCYTSKFDRHRIICDADGGICRDAVFLDYDSKEEAFKHWNTRSHHRADGWKYKELTEFAEWAFECACDGQDADGGEIQDNLESAGLIEKRPTNPEDNEWGAEELYYWVNPNEQAALPPTKTLGV